MSNETNSLAPAVSRAVAILNLLAESSSAPVTLADIARKIGAAKSSTSNICKVLEQADLIQHFHGGFILGRRTAELGGIYLASFDQIWDFYRLCAHSPVLSSELVHLASLNGKNAVIMSRYGGTSHLRLNREIGTSMPAALTALGNALLMPKSNDEIRELYKDEPEFPLLTRQTIRTVDQLIAILDEAREVGYSVDKGGIYPSVFTIGVPVFPVVSRHDSDTVFSVSVSIICPTIPPVLPPAQIELLVSALKDVSQKLNNPMAASPK